MKDVFERFEANGKIYPMAFNINVLEEVQEHYGSFTDFAKAFSMPEPKMKDLKYIYMIAINEGIDMENDPESQFYINDVESKKPLTEKQVGRLIGDLSAASKKIKELITASNDDGKEKDEDKEKNLIAGQ